MAKKVNGKASMIALGVVAGIMSLSTVGLAVKLNRAVTTKEVPTSAFAIGTINDAGKIEEGDGSIYQKKILKVDGLKIDLEKKADVTYQIYYYDEDKAFLSASAEMDSDFDGVAVPESAKYFRVVISPTEDEDGKVSLLEVAKYAKQVTISYNK